MRDVVYFCLVLLFGLLMLCLLLSGLIRFSVRLRVSRAHRAGCVFGRRLLRFRVRLWLSPRAWPLPDPWVRAQRLRALTAFAQSLQAALARAVVLRAAECARFAVCAGGGAGAAAAGGSTFACSVGEGVEGGVVPEDGFCSAILMSGPCRSVRSMTKEIVVTAKATATPAGTHTSRQCFHHALGAMVLRAGAACVAASASAASRASATTWRHRPQTARCASTSARSRLPSACSENALRLSASGCNPCWLVAVMTPPVL